MAEDFIIDNSELEALFRKYEAAPDSYVFAPLADAYRKSGMLDEAVEICRKGIRKHPQYPSGHVVLGKCYFDLGDVDQAETSFQEVLKLDENNLVALKYLGMVLAGRGRLDEAQERFNHILVLDPGNREIKAMLEDIEDVKDSARSESVEKVDDDFEGEPISLGGDDDETSDDLATATLADIYAAQGYADKAARIYREILKRQPDNAEVRRKLQDLEDGGEFSEIVEAGYGDVELADDTDDAAGVAGAERSRNERSERRERGARRLDEGRDGVDLSDRTHLGRPREEFEPVEKAAGTAKTNESTLDDKKSYDQFKRWLENLKKD